MCRILHFSLALPALGFFFLVFLDIWLSSYFAIVCRMSSAVGGGFSGFGCANASCRGNQKRPLINNDLHSLFFSTSLLLPFRPPDRLTASPFLTQPFHLASFTSGPSNGAIFLFARPWRDGRDARPPAHTRFVCVRSPRSDLRRLVPIPTSYYRGTPGWLNLSTFPMKTLLRGLALGLVLPLVSPSMVQGTDRTPAQPFRRCPAFNHATGIAACPDQTGAVGSRALFHQLLGV